MVDLEYKIFFIFLKIFKEVVCFGNKFKFIFDFTLNEFVL